MAGVCVFDVNETLLDLGALDPHFERADLQEVPGRILETESGKVPWKKGLRRAVRSSPCSSTVR